MLINILLYVLLIAGLVLILSGMFKSVMYQMKLRGNTKAITMKKKKEKTGDALTEHLYMLLAVTMGAKSRSAVNLFSFICGLIGLASYLLCSLFLPLKTCLIVMVACIFMPYIFLRTKLQQIRVNISHEGETLVTEILNNYKIQHYNIREAVEQTALTITEAPHSKKMMFDLAKNLNTAASAEETKAALDLFKYSIGTSWANILASNIYFAQVEGTKITNSLTDLTDAIMKARKAVEMNRRENTEGLMILKWMVPIGFVLTIIGADKFFDIPFKEFCYYQFQSPTGLNWFLGLVGMYIASIVISIFLSKSKMDI